MSGPQHTDNCIHWLQDVEWKASKMVGVVANPRKSLTVGLENHLEKCIFLLSKQTGLPGLHSILDASWTFIFCHCKEVS